MAPEHVAVEPRYHHNPYTTNAFAVQSDSSPHIMNGVRTFGEGGGGGGGEEGGERVQRPISLNMSLRRPFHEGLKLKQEKWAVTRNASGPS